MKTILKRTLAGFTTVDVSTISYEYEGKSHLLTDYLQKGKPNRNHMYYAIMQNGEDFANLGQLYLDDLVFNDEGTVNDDWIGMVENAQVPFQEPRYVQEEEEKGEPELQEGNSFQFWLPLDFNNSMKIVP